MPTTQTDECFVLLGPNGSGKSTAFSVLSGVYRPTGGAASIMGADLQTQLAAARQHVGVCWQDDMLYDDLSVKEHLKFMSRLKGVVRVGALGLGVGCWGLLLIPRWMVEPCCVHPHARSSIAYLFDFFFFFVLGVFAASRRTGSVTTWST